MRHGSLVWLVLGAVAAARLWLAAAVPLTDTTEARFGEIARKMVETGDWLTPQHDYGVAYLAKPPLAFWLSAVGIQFGGAAELAPRALILAAALGFCVFLYRFARRQLGAAAALAALLVLMTSLLFFVSMAAVMTDMILTICVGTALLAFWNRYTGGSWRAEVALFVALGLGLLAKGPLAVLLALAPIVIWSVAAGCSRDVWRAFAWWRGALLALLIAAPWYIAAEWRNPGFLDYFIVGEHLQRFLVPGWSGDLYGRAHDAPRGTIWLFFVIGALPWSLVGLPLLLATRETVRRNWRDRRALIGFLVTAASVPLLLFTFSGNVILPYALPALPAAALAFVALLTPAQGEARHLRTFALVGAVPIALLTVLVPMSAGFIDTHTQRPVIRAIEARHPRLDVALLYWQTRYFSAEYYSRGRADTLTDPQAIERALATRDEFCLVVEQRSGASIPEAISAQLQEVAVVGGFSVLEPRYFVATAPERS
jgi:4-amino-4-deoxy-L-arabinose transferase-like glycosyltransferase